jgi:hypothetical protein
MSGHTPYTQLRQKKWPPGKLHDDIQLGKREVFRFGDWSIYDATKVGGVTNAHWNSFIMHCRAWKEWKAVQRPPATTWLKDAYADPDSNGHYKIEVAKRCNANMTAETNSHCVECGVKIPDEVVALWKLQNFDKIQEFNSV